MLSLFGYSVFLFLFFGALWQQACRWRYLSRRYAGKAERPLSERKWQYGVLIGLGGFNSLKGILNLRAHETGLTLRVVAPFSLFHDPLFIPYRDIEGWAATWYLNAPSIELAFRQAPDVKMIVPADTAEWIATSAGRQVRIYNVEPPDGNAGRGWHAFTIANMSVSLVMLAFVLVAVMSQWFAG